MEVTLKEILDQLRIFVDEHYQLLSFGFGDMANISTKDTLYPILYVAPTESRMNGTQVILGLDMYIFDLEKQDKSNLETVMSNSLSIGTDVVANFLETATVGLGVDKKYDVWSIVDNTVRMYPAEFKQDDVLAGYQFSFEIEIENTNNKCVIPKS